MTLLAILLLACDPPEGEGDDTSTDETGEPAEEEHQMPVPTYSGGACPELVEGTNTDFASGGEARSFELRLPEDPAGAPVVFAWHWLGGSAKQIIRYMQMETVVDAGAILIAPESCCAAFEWDFAGEPEGNVDLAFFDDLLGCVHEQFQPDLTRVYSTGMSAGGLWTTYLTLHRSEWHAATAPFSGGTEGLITYSTPTDDIPVLVTWGGEDDLYGPVSFETASEGLTEDLLQDGHFVVNCDHGGGHTIPDGAVDMAWSFFQDHPKFVDPEPYAGELPDTLPDWCWTPTP